ncbi:periplasmic heavy metal sensor [Parasulfitobacter algicola]|uniref:Periplasmic heavy metal sensor n=1 Tax=Parasulfitobacter algicola TaxID=2614809 RepID=A0ABX2IM02_9RHOB|nr:periplasmic heavy metal sensor [Sulfitobacter algicola]NSX53913.1 periplasmic heavy metal sensor [Sulfitobacter algicola]
MQNALKKKLPLWIKIGFAISLALNFLIVGIVLGRVFTNQPVRAGSQIFSPYARALDPSDRRQISQQLFNVSPEQMQGMRRGFQDVFDLLRAETLDTDAVERILSDQSTFLMDRQKFVQSMLIQRLQTMTHEERLSYVDRLEKILQRRRMR